MIQLTLEKLIQTEWQGQTTRILVLQYSKLFPILTWQEIISAIFFLKL